MISKESRPVVHLVWVFVLVLCLFARLFQPNQGSHAAGRASLEPQAYLPLVSRSCYVQFFDDFSDPTSGWDTDGLPLTMYWEDEYLIFVTSDDRWGIGTAQSPAGPISDVLITVDARKELGGGIYGISFGHSVEGYYLFRISEASGYSIVFRRSVDESIALASGSSPAITGGIDTIALERTGTVVRAYANGKLLADLKDDSYTGPGDAGLWINSWGYTDLMVFFDNFKVEPAGCGWGAKFE
jgi:hypothetical protein